MGSACQPIRPVDEAASPAATTGVQGPIAVAEPLTATVAITDAVEVSATAPVAEAAAADPALVAAGRDVYLKQYCGVCHALTAAGTTGTFGPAHDGLGSTAAQRILDEAYHGAATTAAEYIRESIVDPTAYTVPGYATTSHRMPAYSHLTGETLDALVAFLAAQ